MKRSVYVLPIRGKEKKGNWGLTVGGYKFSKKVHWMIDFTTFNESDRLMSVNMGIASALSANHSDAVLTFLLPLWSACT